MFQITCFVKDPKLAEVLRVLDGMVYELKVVPVTEKAPPKVKIKSDLAKPKGSRGKMQKAIDEIRSINPGSHFQISDFTEKHGRATATRAVAWMKRNGEVKRVSYGIYELKAPKRLDQME